MKTSVKYSLMISIGMIALSACTMGDKGGNKVPDSVSIDTAIRPAQPKVKASDTTLIDSLQTDTVKK